MPSQNLLKMVTPKGRLQDKVSGLLDRIGISLTSNTRSYRPLCSDLTIEVKSLKPQNVPSLIALGRHDCGFTGHDWVTEEKLHSDGNLVELLDLGFDPVRIVAAMPESLLAEGALTDGRRLVVASEYQHVAQDYIARKGLNAVLVKTYGATEALPPEDADLIVDNTSTGTTLAMNRLTIVDELLTSTTRFVASRSAMEDPWKNEKLTQMVMLMQSTLLAKQRVLLEMNVSPEDLDALVANLPCMRAPTVASLYGNAGFAVKVSVPVGDVPQLVPKLRAMGAKDILVYRLEKIVP